MDWDRRRCWEMDSDERDFLECMVHYFIILFTSRLALGEDEHNRDI